MTEMLSTVLQAVLTVVIPIIASYFIKYLNAQVSLAAARQGNELVTRYLEEIAKAVENAVLFTSQTYTDQMKKSGSFNLEEQKEALKRALQMAKGALTSDALSFISMTYGDLQAYLTLQIEAEVRAQKG